MGAYLRLSKDALRKEVRTWKMPAKLHSFIHLCEDVPNAINARFVWCYGDEDLQKAVKGVASTLHSRTVAENTLYKLVVYFECETDSDDDNNHP